MQLWKLYAAKQCMKQEEMKKKNCCDAQVIEKRKMYVLYSVLHNTHTHTCNAQLISASASDE